MRDGQGESTSGGWATQKGSNIWDNSINEVPAASDWEKQETAEVASEWGNNSKSTRQADVRNNKS